MIDADGAKSLKNNIKSSIILAFVSASRPHRQSCQVKVAGCSITDGRLFKVVKDTEADMEIEKLERLLLFKVAATVL